MTKPKATPSELANQYWARLEPILLEGMRMQMTICKASFTEGYEEGKKDGVRTKSVAKRDGVDNTTT